MSPSRRRHGASWTATAAAMAAEFGEHPHEAEGAEDGKLDARAVGHGGGDEERPVYANDQGIEKVPRIVHPHAWAKAKIFSPSPV